MKSFVVFFLALCAVASSAAADGFLKSIPADQFAAAGLNKLTEEELAQLERLIATREAGMKVAAAAADAAATKPEAKASGPGWLRALVTLQETAEKPEAAEAIVTRLAGDYDGWTGKTVFNLENGQIWQQVSGGERIDDRRAAPTVKIYPGMMGAYWLEIEGVRERVKVRPVKLK
ncbi:MAG TPA: hypothetical protein VK477_07765 [Acidobacteriota bacterium]|nr:hypothetical protein [Acidobacteriota bacterium]